ncbi:MAG: DegT/DnrJ/EryC1/StrS family aminotransferase [Rhodobacter sp.]|nr:DegT/DnrJ/EryC1/StrS family aminotransferase [Rhodobacter sp.]
MKTMQQNRIRSKRFVLPDPGPTLAEIRTAIESGWLSTGPYTRRLEETLAADLSAPVFAASSAMDALEIVLEHLAPAGRQVFLPANCFQAVPSMVTAAGATPVALGVSPETHAGDIAALADLPPAILIHVHSFGISSARELRGLDDLRQRGWFVIVDSANLLPDEAYLQHRPTGEGIAELLSFNPTKPVASAKGGALVTADSGLSDYAEAARAHSGREHIWDGGGHIYRDRQIGEINAIMAYHQWARRADIQSVYRALQRAYDNRLASGDYSVTAGAGGSLTVPTRYPVQLPEGVDLFAVAEAMSLEGIDCSVMYGVPWTAHAAFGAAAGADDVTCSLISRTLCLPLHEAMGEDEPGLVLDVLEHCLTR